jgi:hypothetical protein
MMRAFVSAAIRVPAALGMASAATPSGQITANPATVIIPAEAPWGTTLLSWTTTNCAVAQVTVSAPGCPETLFAEAVSFLNASAPWIGFNTFTFRLYGDSTRMLLLDSVVVTGVPAPSGSITANPLTFNLASAEATFTTTLSWTTSAGSGAWVTSNVGIYYISSPEPVSFTDWLAARGVPGGQSAAGAGSGRRRSFQPLS